MNTGLLYEWMRNEWMTKQALCLLNFIFYFLFTSEGSFLPLLPQSLTLECSLGKAGHCYTLSFRSLPKGVRMGQKWAWGQKGRWRHEPNGKGTDTPKDRLFSIMGYGSGQAIIPGSKSGRQTPPFDPSPTSRCHRSGRTRGFLQLPVEVGGFTVSTWSRVKPGAPKPICLFKSLATSAAHCGRRSATESKPN